MTVRLCRARWLAAALLVPTLMSRKSGEDLTYSQFRSEVEQGNVDSITVTNGWRITSPVWNCHS